MNRIFKLSLSIFLLPLFSYAQSNFKPGYVVTLKGDTLKGFIDYKEWGENPKAIIFKKDINSNNTENFSVKNANAFAINDLEYYERYVVAISQDPIDVTKVGSKIDTSSLTDAIFLRLLNKGRYMSLYSYQDDIKYRFYMLETGEIQPQELGYHAYYRSDESSSIQYVNRFRTQLEYLAQKKGINNDKLSQQIEQCGYSEAELTRLAQKINGKSSQQFTKSLFGTRWFAGAALNYSSFGFKNDAANGTGTGNPGDFILSNAPASNSIAPRIDMGIDLFTNKNVQKFYFRAELSLTYGQYNFSYTNSGGTPQGGTTTLNFKQYNAVITPQIIYNIYNQQQLKIFIDAGIAVNSSFYNHYQLITTFSSFSPNIQDEYPKFSQTWVAFPIKAGAALNGKVEVYICYVPTTSVTNFHGNYGSFSSNITSYQAGLNYLIGGSH